MRFRLQGNVTIPAKPKTIGGIIGWARGVNRSLQELRDRKVIGTAPRRGGGDKIPFRVSLLASGDPVTYNVTVGWGYVCVRNPGNTEIISYEEPSNMFDGDDLAEFAISADQAVYIKLEVDPDSLVTGCLIVVADDEEESLHPIPASYDEPGVDGYYYFKLAKLAAPVPPSEVPKLEKWLTGSHIDYFLPEKDKYLHPWKVTYSGETPSETEGEPPTHSWDVFGDTVWGQGTEITVANESVAGGAGFIMLKITRDETTRELSTVVLEHAATVTASYNTDQYRVIAKVDPESNPKVIQYQFEEIRIFEDLCVVNGAFKLVGLEMSHRQYYDPP